jgi:hypothetical protein
MFVFLPASAGAGFVPSNLWNGTDYGLGHDIPVFIQPLAVFALKPRPFMMNILKAVPFIGGLKFHGPFGIAGTALENRKDLKAQPPRLLTPGPGLLNINFRFLIFDTGTDDVVNGMLHIGGITAAHKRLRGGGLLGPQDIGFTTFAIGAAGTAGTGFHLILLTIILPAITQFRLYPIDLSRSKAAGP